MGPILCIPFWQKEPQFVGEVVKKKKMDNDIPRRGCQRLPIFDAHIEVRTEDGHIVTIIGPPSAQVWDTIEVGGFYSFDGIECATPIAVPKKCA